MRTTPLVRSGNGPLAGVFALLFLLLWQVLLSVQNPGLMSDDSGEMVAASYVLGLPHPPGYPLYCLLGHVFSWLPVGTVAFRSNLLSALAGLLALFFILDTCRKLASSYAGGEGERGKRGLAVQLLLPLFVMVSLFFNQGFFSQALSAKGLVYMLSFLAISVLVWYRVRRELEGAPSRAGRGLYPVLFLFLLGFANHWQTFILLVPFMVIWHFQERNPWRAKNTLVAASLGSIAFSLYLYLPLRSVLGVQPDWGEPSNLTRFLWVVGRGLAVEGEGGESFLRSWEHYRLWGGEYLRVMVSSWWPGLWLVGILGTLVLWSRSRRLTVGLLALYLSVLAGLLTVPRDETLFLLGVYLIAIHGTFMVFAFFGLTFILRTLHDWRPWMAWVVGGFLLFALLQQGRGILRSEDRSRVPLVQDLGANLLKDLPRGALFLAEGDHMLMPLWYAKFVERKRKDIEFQPAPFLLHEWGWAQLVDRDPRYQMANLPGQTFQQRLKLLTLAPRPLFYSLDRNYLGGELGRMAGSWTPAGLVFEWGKARVPAREVSRKVLRAEYARRLRGVPEYIASSGRDLSTDEILHYYAQPHYLTAHLLRGEGSDWPAVRHLALGIEYRPVASAYGNLAVLLGELGKEGLALKYAELARRAREREGTGTPK